MTGPYNWRTKLAMVVIRQFLKSLATGFGIGMVRKAPGTVGTLATLPLCALLMWLGPLVHMAFVALFTPVAIASAEIFENDEKTHDLPQVIVDEILGMMIAVVWMPLTWQTFLIGFLLFRFFDILKPFPIGLMDRKMKGGVGVVADDVAAGIIVNIIMQVIYTQTSWLGVQLVTS